MKKSSVRHSIVILLAVLWLGVGISSCASSNKSSAGDMQLSAPEARFAEAKAAYDKGEWLDAIRMFEEVRVQSPTSELAVEATYLEAMARFRQESFSGAAIDFRALRRNYPNSPLAARAQYMVGESYFYISPKPQLDQSYAVAALTEFQSFLRDFRTAPQSLIDSAQQRIVDIREKLAEKTLYSANLYMKMEDPKSAVIYYNRVLDQYYDTKSAPEAQLRIAEINYDRKKVEDARKALDQFEQKYLKAASEEQRQRALKLRSRLPQS